MIPYQQVDLIGSIMLQNLLIVLFGIPQFLPIMLVLCFLRMHYADNL